jgi:hypothetical protein
VLGARRSVTLEVAPSPEDRVSSPHREQSRVDPAATVWLSFSASSLSRGADVARARRLSCGRKSLEETRQTVHVLAPERDGGMRPESPDELCPQVELPLMLHGVIDCPAAVRGARFSGSGGRAFEAGRDSVSTGPGPGVASRPRLGPAAARPVVEARRSAHSLNASSNPSLRRQPSRNEVPWS